MDRGFLNKQYLIQRFKDQGLESYRSIVQFYENHRADINQLDFDEFFEIYTEYANALYEIGAHHKFIKQADKIIELSIERNLVYYNGKDIFQFYLLKKAYAYYNLGMLDRCEKVVMELLKIDPDKTIYRDLFAKSVNKRKSISRINTRMYATVLLLLSAVIIGFELFVIRLFMPELTTTFEIMRSMVFVSGIVLMVIAELSSWIHARMKVEDYIQKVKKKHSK